MEPSDSQPPLSSEDLAGPCSLCGNELLGHRNPEVASRCARTVMERQAKRLGSPPVAPDSEAGA